MHLGKAEAAIKLLPGKLKAGFAMLPVLRHQLDQIDQRHNSPFEPLPEEPDWRKIARMTWWAFRNR